MGDIPQGWKLKSLREVAACRRQQVKPEPTDNRPYVALEHIEQGNPRLLRWDRAGNATSTKFLFRQADVLFGKLRPNLKKAVQAPFDGLCSTDILPITALDETCNEFLLHLCHWPQLQQHAISTASGTKMPRTAWKLLSSFRFALPPLVEQWKIAAILSSVDEAIEKTQAVIDQGQVVKKSLMQELLTRGLSGYHTRFTHTEIGAVPEEWEGTTLGELAGFVTSGSRGWAKYYAENGALFIRSQNVRAGILDLDDSAFVKPPTGAEGSRTRVLAHDVLVTITGNSVGNVAYAPEGLGEAYVSQHVGLVRLKQPELAPYVTQYFSPGAPGNWQILAAQYGQSKPGLNLTDLRSFVVPLPSTEEREQIADGLLSMQRRIDAEQDVQAGLERLKQGLMSSLLSGEIRVIREDAVEVL